MIPTYINPAYSLSTNRPNRFILSSSALHLIQTSQPSNIHQSLTIELPWSTRSGCQHHILFYPGPQDYPLWNSESLLAYTASTL